MTTKKKKKEQQQQLSNDEIRKIDWEVQSRVAPDFARLVQAKSDSSRQYENEITPLKESLEQKQQDFKSVLEIYTKLDTAKQEHFERITLAEQEFTMASRRIKKELIDELVSSKNDNEQKRLR